MSNDARPTRLHQPIILIRGFGGMNVEDEKKLPYQGFNDGTVYHGKRGENFIYEGLVLRFLKSHWRYRDATNIVSYSSRAFATAPAELPEELRLMDPAFFHGAKLVIDPAMALALLRDENDSLKSLWVFRYYDLDDRLFDEYGKALVRLIDFIQALVKLKAGVDCKVNIIAHSMGGLIVRHAIQRTLPQAGREPDRVINKVVTLGTPHQGISFQVLKNWIGIDAEKELEVFNPGFQEQDEELGYQALKKHFSLPRFLTVVGTNYRSYGVRSSSILNRLFSISGEYGLNYNRSDGLVKQSCAQIPGAPRTFVHKCHGGEDSLVTSRETFEIASRFFFGDVKAELRLESASVKRGLDFFGKSEIFLGVSVKPRCVDFDLFHQSKEAENCYGPFHTKTLKDKELAFPWTGTEQQQPERLVWEGWLDTTQRAVDAKEARDMVIRLEFYVGERDIFGVGFSDNLIFHHQCYVRSVMNKGTLSLQSFASEKFQAGVAGKPLTFKDGKWLLDVGDANFKGVFSLALLKVPETGEPTPLGASAVDSGVPA